MQVNLSIIWVGISLSKNIFVYLLNLRRAVIGPMILTMSISETKKKQIWDASGHRCSYCRAPLTFKAATIDHITPKSAFKQAGEADKEENLCIACKTCNTAKAAMSVKEFRKWVNIRHGELLKLEAEQRSAIARAKELSKEIKGKKFTFIHHLRKQGVKNFLLPQNDDSSCRDQSGSMPR